MGFEVFEDSVVLTLESHCIESAARHAYRILTSQLFTEGIQHTNAIKILEDFLTSENFAKLRTSYPKLAGGVSCAVRLWRDQNGRVRWECVEGRANLSEKERSDE